MTFYITQMMTGSPANFSSFDRKWQSSVSASTCSIQRKKRVVCHDHSHYYDACIFSLERASMWESIEGFSRGVATSFSPPVEKCWRVEKIDRVTAFEIENWTEWEVCRTIFILTFGIDVILFDGGSFSLPTRPSGGFHPSDTQRMTRTMSFMYS